MVHIGLPRPGILLSFFLSIGRPAGFLERKPSLTVGCPAVRIDAKRAPARGNGLFRRARYDRQRRIASAGKGLP